MATIFVPSRWGRRQTLQQRIIGYVQTFRSPPGVTYVLPDLAEYCRAAEEPVPAGTTDPFEIGRRIGRLDVWRRIQDHLHLDEEELYALARGRASLRPEDFSHADRSRQTDR